MIQMDDAAAIRRRWEQAGRPPCAHKDLDREYYLGSNTGDYICLSCGKEFSRAEWTAMQQRPKDEG
jgi:hypothetical protein